MKINRIVVAGGGVLGSQIAFQAAYCGFDVTIWLRSKESITRTQPKLDSLKKTYIDTICKMATPTGKTPDIWANGIADYKSFNEKSCIKKVEVAYSNIKLELNMESAVKNADLVIECMAEKIDEKIAFYKKLAPLLARKTIVVTNSSSLLPSKFAKHTGRPEKYLALHFANNIWKSNIAEVMAHSKTDTKYFNQIIAFAEEIRMVPVPIYKEKSGYLLNSMLGPLLFSSLDLYANGISDPKSIDKAWTLSTGAPKGPFQILDIIGLNTIYNVVQKYLKVPSFLTPYNFKEINKIIEKRINEGKLGVSAGEGFYIHKNTK
jgi:3-hydroxyacyl-CoA dehydrogenase